MADALKRGGASRPRARADIWGIRCTPRCLGGYCTRGADRIRVYSDGKLVRGDPRALPLREHEEIVLTYGTKAELPKPIPSSYPFPAGL